MTGVNFNGLAMTYQEGFSGPGLSEPLVLGILQNVAI